MHQGRVHVLHNLTNLLQPCDDCLVAVHKGQARVLDTRLLRKCLDKLLALT